MVTARLLGELEQLNSLKLHPEERAGLVVSLSMKDQPWLQHIRLWNRFKWTQAAQAAACLWILTGSAGN